MTALVYHPDTLKHETGMHPERPERLTSVMKTLEKHHLLDKLLRLKPKAAPLDDVKRVHTPDYIDEVREMSKAGGGFLDRDTPVSPETFRASLLSAGGALAGLEAVAAGEAVNAFALLRPPGHHAFRNRGSGFCVFNNTAICARAAQARKGWARVLIVDWDVHHGNGTQDIFYYDPSVLYFSSHLFPHYPGTGSEEEQGWEKGEGSTINAPLLHGSDDDVVLSAYREKLLPAADQFRPDFVVVSAGFDSHREETLGGLSLSAQGFYELTRMARGIAEKHCQGRLVSVLEGGYNLDSLPYCVIAHLDGLADLGAGDLYRDR